MANYKSESVTLKASAETVYNKLSNLDALDSMLKNAPVDMIPEDKRSVLEQIRVQGDTIMFPAGPMGAITLKRTKSVEPSLIGFEGQGTPVPMGLSLHISPVNEYSCEAYVEFDLQIPAMLKPMINGPLKKMTGEFGNILRSIPF